MKEWEEIKDEIWEIKPDTELAKSILKMSDTRLDAINSLDKKKFTSIIAENYYEIVKELLTSLMSADGYKTLSHEALITYLKKFYKEFTEDEIVLIDQARQLRNKIVYRGFFVQENYLQMNEKQLTLIITKLKNILEKKLGD